MWVPAQALVWANTRDWPEPPKPEPGCTTSPAPPGSKDSASRLLQCQNMGNKTLKSFRDSLDVFCEHDSTFSSTHQEFSPLFLRVGCLKSWLLSLKGCGRTVSKERGRRQAETFNKQPKFKNHQVLFTNRLKIKSRNPQQLLKVLTWCCTTKVLGRVSVCLTVCCLTPW